MSKILPASCQGGVVKIKNSPQDDAEILSEGVGASEGIALIDESQIFYLPKGSPDLKATLDNLVNVLTQISTGLEKTASALTKLDTNGFLIAADAGVPSDPIATADISGISSAKAQVDTIKSQLDTLKGNMR